MHKIEHIAIIVPDIDKALGFWRDALGLALENVEDVTSQGARVAFIPLGDSEIELVQPLTENSSLNKYLEKHGPGLHHICLEVDDIEAALTRLKTQGVKLINKTPVEGAGGSKVAFIHPKSASGVLVELSQPGKEK